jgi:anti-sigma factor RsiW
MSIDDTELHAFVDGALEAERRRAVEAELQSDPALAERIAAYRADMATMKRIYAPVAEQALPEAWMARIQGATAKPAPVARQTFSWRMVGTIAATLLIAVVAVGWWSMQTRPASEVVQAAIDARAEPSQAGTAVAVAAEATPAQYNGALRAAVAMNVKVPDMSRMGYRLTGMRVYESGATPRAAELLYNDRAGRLFTLYVRHSDGSARFDQFERNGLRVCVWQDDQLALVMAGDVSTAAMQRLASLAYTGMTI